MARKKHSPEQIVAILRQIEVAIANNEPTPQACREAGINEQSWCRWRKEHGGLKLEQVRRLKVLEKRTPAVAIDDRVVAGEAGAAGRGIGKNF
jgi:hypothetical protein